MNRRLIKIIGLMKIILDLGCFYDILYFIGVIKNEDLDSAANRGVERSASADRLQLAKAEEVTAESNKIRFFMVYKI